MFTPSDQPAAARPTVADVAVAVASAIQQAGKIQRFDPVEHCKVVGRDFIRMHADRGVTHSVFLPAPAAMPAGRTTAFDIMRNSGFRMDRIFSQGVPDFSGTVPQAVAQNRPVAG